MKKGAHYLLDRWTMFAMSTFITTAFGMSAVRHTLHGLMVRGYATTLSEPERRQQRLRAYDAMMRLVGLLRTRLQNPDVELLDGVQVAIEKAIEAESKGWRVADAFAMMPIPERAAAPTEPNAGATVAH